MMAWTSPAFTARLSPSRIFLPSISTCKFWTSSMGIPRILHPELSSVRPHGDDPVRRHYRARPGNPCNRPERGGHACAGQARMRVKTTTLTDAPLQADRDQLLRLDRELHRELLQHVFDEAVDDERDRLLLRE